MNKSLTPEGNLRARRFYRKLLFSYLGVTLAVLGSSAILVYIFVARSLHRQLESELVILAESAAPSLKIANQSDPTVFSEYFSGASDEHWHALEQHSQSLEWFDAQGQLLVREGKVFPSTALDLSARDVEVSVQSGEEKLYVATLPVYGGSELVGVVRASEAARIIDVPLRHLLWGLIVGGGVGTGVIVFSSLWLSRLALSPYIENYKRLRQFTADASHEMRGPLSIIKLAFDLAWDSGEIPDSQKGNLAKIGEAANQLRLLIEALLALARLDSGIDTAASTLPFQTIPLHELLQDLVELFGDLASEKGVKVIGCDFSAISVEGNQSQLFKVFSNLLENALKYTPNGGEVTVNLLREGKKAIARVADTGIGIASEDMPHVFDRFWRADQARSHQTEGLGLGLAISYDIVKRHKGDISVRSTVGQGSTFEVSLPAL